MIACASRTLIQQYQPNDLEQCIHLGYIFGRTQNLPQYRTLTSNGRGEMDLFCICPQQIQFSKFSQILFHINHATSRQQTYEILGECD